MTSADLRIIAAPPAAHPNATPTPAPLSGGFGQTHQKRAEAGVIRTRAELDAARRILTGRVVLVPTMGALHEGHRALIRAAHTLGDHVIVSIFVNPAQFGPGEDFDRYPRTPKADLEMCADEEVDLVFLPDADDMYGPGLGIRIEAGDLADRLEGAVRPGHFSGVLTVVAKLFGMVDPHAAVFGEKDYQQLVLLRAMARELALRTEVYGVPTVREVDGLALSSRNRYLDEHQRMAARTLSRALRTGALEALHGAASVLAAAQGVLDDEPTLGVDYLVLKDPDLGPAPMSGPARLLVAARLGSTRLIDNVPVSLGRPASAANDFPAQTGSRHV
ncbi:MAG: pantoate--beta-alanine ligase [Actinomycetota bacterium]|nr:pantoate--beta-alanine ligase [Actinomycetota bacterium]